MNIVDNVPLPRLPDDAICLAVGSSHYMRPHRFNDLYIETPGGRSPRLAVSRFYWDLDPPVAVDFLRELRFGELEVATKKRYFKDLDIKYLWLKDAWDGEGAEEQLRVLDPISEQVQAIKDAARPLVGPRRQRT